MTPEDDFDLSRFLPYLANQAAEALSLEFQHHYRDKYGLLRTEWRVLFHLGQYGEMTASEICMRARLHKTKVSRAVAALEQKRFVARRVHDKDKRHANLSLTRSGYAAFADLRRAAETFDEKLRASLGEEAAQVFEQTLTKIASLSTQR